MGRTVETEDEKLAIFQHSEVAKLLFGKDFSDYIATVPESLRIQVLVAVNTHRDKSSLPR